MTMRESGLLLTISVSIATALSGCVLFFDEELPSNDSFAATTDTGADSGADASGSTDTGADTGSDVLDEADVDPGPTLVEVSEPIVADTTWTNDNIYILTDTIFVDGNNQLTIEAGTEIRGQSGSALIVTRDATINARGTADEPIVFTSAKPAGERTRADWGGVVLLGNAPTALADRTIEGLEEGDTRGGFGGSDADSNCGVLQYVRIEFAGFEAFANNELNGLTLGGCGRRTVLRYVQVHQTLDDGIEFFGGMADMRNIVISSAGDDSLDWDTGWQGRVQFLIIQQENSAEVGDHGWEADNVEKEDGQTDAVYDLQPRSNPTIYNVTMVGSNNPEGGQRGMNLRRGTGVTARNIIMIGFPNEAVDFRDSTVPALIGGSTEDGATLDLRNMIFFNIGEDGASYFSDEPTDGSDGDDDGGVVEEDYFRDGTRMCRFGVNPLLPQEVFDNENPNFVPSGTSPAAQDGATPPEGEFWDGTASYLGAVRPGTNPDAAWYAGWTAFPPN